MGKILIIDDSTESIKLVSEILKKENHEGEIVEFISVRNDIITIYKRRYN